jgi:hypothetical protein
MRRHNCVDEVSAKRPGHQPFRSSIEDRLNSKAHRDSRADSVNRALWRMRLARA